MRIFLQCAVLAAATLTFGQPLFAQSKVVEGNWFLSDTVDRISGKRSVLIGVHNAAGGTLGFTCQNPGNKNAKIFATLISSKFLGQSSHLQFIFLKFDEDESQKVVGDYIGRNVANFSSSKFSEQAFQRVRSAKNVTVRVFRYDNIAIDEDISISPQQTIWERFRNQCLSSNR